MEFSSTLNDTTKSIKAENKIASMQNIAEMYIKLGDYSKSYTNDNLQINIIDTKKNIIQAYVYVTENNWDMALNSINKADESFGNAGILDVFPIFKTARMGQKIRCSAETELFRVSL